MAWNHIASSVKASRYIWKDPWHRERTYTRTVSSGCRTVVQSVVELWARLCSLLAPIIKFQLLIAFITQLKVVVPAGIRCPGTSDLCLNQRLHPSASLQPVTHGLQCCHLNMKTAEDDDKLLFTILLWPLPLDLLCQSKQQLVECDDWSLARVCLLYTSPSPRDS